uniref:Uncharacterized protein n=1 Tax=Timema genevievae TaxID=629358 RepID=A0A7R9K739_TIMGE|nr:unnamed protein product [Timema genevievae]
MTRVTQHFRNIEVLVEYKYLGVAIGNLLYSGLPGLGRRERVDTLVTECSSSAKNSSNSTPSIFIALPDLILFLVIIITSNFAMLDLTTLSRSLIPFLHSKAPNMERVPNTRSGSVLQYVAILTSLPSSGVHHRSFQSQKLLSHISLFWLTVLAFETNSKVEIPPRQIRLEPSPAGVGKWFVVKSLAGSEKALLKL